MGGRRRCGRRATAEHGGGGDPRDVGLPDRRRPAAGHRALAAADRGGFYRGGGVLSSAVAGLDQALWDLRGHCYGRPVHELLGGPYRDRVGLRPRRR
jgi:L-alanine-DL-glutamate epimerase-like enolase superfamily enzyme